MAAMVVPGVGHVNRRCGALTAGSQFQPTIAAIPFDRTKNVIFAVKSIDGDDHSWRGTESR